MAAEPPRDDARRPTWTSTLIVVALPAANLFLFGPHIVHALNAAEFTHGFGAYAPLLAGLTATATLLAALVLRALPPGLGSRLLTLIFSLGLLSWIQGGWLLGNYGLLDGSPLSLSRPGLWEGALWVAVIMLAQILHGAMRRHWTFLAGVLIAVQLVGAMVSGTDRQAPTVGAPSDALDPSMLRFSRDRNIILLIHDTFTTDMFLATRQADAADFDDRFDGFTIYHDALGLYPTTEPSVATMFGLPAYHNRVPVQVYKDRVWRSGSLLDLAQRSGVDVDWIAPSPYFCRETKTTSCFGMPLRYASPESIRLGQALQLVDISLFRQVPQSLKPAVYRDGRWLAQTLLTDSDVPAAKPVSSVAVFDELIDGMTVDRTGTSLKIIHLAGGHPPLVLDGGCGIVDTGEVNALNTARQLDCSLGQTRRFLERLDELGVFDDALIVLMGDHGSSFGAPDVPGHPLRPAALSRARTLLAIKWPGQRGVPGFSAAPVSLLDIGPTVAAAAGISSTLPGIDIANLPEDTRRSRPFGLFTLRARANMIDGHLRRLERFTCDGASEDPAAWSLAEVVFPPRWRLPGTRIDLGSDAEADQISYHGWGPGQTDGSTDWQPALGRFASVYASLGNDSVRIVARLRGTGSVRVDLDDTLVATWTLSPTWTLHEVELSASDRPAISTLTLRRSASLDVDVVEFLPVD